MIIDAELRAWLNDRAAQRRADLEARNFGQDWGRQSPHRDFEARMAQIGDAPDPDAVAGAARELLDDESWVDAAISRLADAMRANPYFEPPFPALHGNIHSGLLVYEDRHLTVAAGVSRLADMAIRKQAAEGRGSVNFTGQLSLYKFLKSGGVTLAFWDCDPIGPTFSAATAGECRPAGTRRIADGETVIVDGRRQGFVMEHAGSNFLVLQANVKTGQAPVSAEFDSASRRFIGCSAVDEGECRIQMAATLVRMLGHQDGFAAIAPFLDHPSFFVRWHAMKELLGIDAQAALPRLKLMAARDPHPDARAAARQALDRIAMPATPRKAA